MNFKFFILILFSTICVGQETNLNYARSVIQTLTSESFAGRGYVESGMQKSARFIADEFQKIMNDEMQKALEIACK